MTELRTQIQSKLETLATANHCGAGVLELSQGESKLRCRVISTDRLACEIESVQVLSPSLSSLDEQALKLLTETLADRISYLEETLTVVETDAVMVESQLRSAKPLVVEETKSYFELRVGRNGMMLQRFEKSPGNHRTTIPAVLSRSILCRLCVDVLDLIYSV